MSFRYFFKLIILATLLSLGQLAFAVSPIDTAAGQSAVGVTNPGQVQNNLLRTNQPPPRKAGLGISNKFQPAAPIPEAEKIKLKLTRVIINGNTVFSSEELEAIFVPFYNKTISLLELQGLVDSITAKYRAAGYILSQALLPPQVIKNGVVKVDVVEGFIASLTIDGKPRAAKEYVERYGQPILQSRPLNLAVLEKALLLANDIPGLSAQALITPSKNVPNAADLTIFANLKRFAGYLVYDNFGTRYLGPQEVSFGGEANSVLLPGDSNALHFTVTSRTRELHFGEFVHTQLIGSKGLKFLLGTNYTQTHPEFILAQTDTIGRSFSIYSSLTYPLIRSRDKNLSISGLANYQNVTSTILGTPFYQDRIRSLTFGTNFDNTDSWSGSNVLSLAAEQGFPILGAHMHYYQSRPRGRARFTKLTINASRLQALFNRFSFYLGMEGQYAFNPLLVSEQFSYGGPVFGRGYDPSEIVGDRGLAGKAELRYQLNPEFRLLHDIQFFVFYDAGEIFNLDTVDLPRQQSATSTGVGFNVDFIPNIQGQFFIGKPLTKKVAIFVAMKQNPTQARAFFQIIARL